MLPMRLWPASAPPASTLARSGWPPSPAGAAGAGPGRAPALPTRNSAVSAPVLPVFVAASAVDGRPFVAGRAVDGSRFFAAALAPAPGGGLVVTMAGGFSPRLARDEADALALVAAPDPFSAAAYARWPFPPARIAF